MGERGICPACSRSFKLTRTGLVARHQTRGSALFCPGSGQRPLPHGRQRCTSLNPQCWSKALGYSRCDCPGDDGPLGEQLPRPTVLVMKGGETGNEDCSLGHTFETYGWCNACGCYVSSENGGWPCPGSTTRGAHLRRAAKPLAKPALCPAPTPEAP